MCADKYKRLLLILPSVCVHPFAQLMATKKGAMCKQSSHIVESYFGIHVLEEIDIITRMSISC